MPISVKCGHCDPPFCACSITVRERFFDDPSLSDVFSAKKIVLRKSTGAKILVLVVVSFNFA